MLEQLVEDRIRAAVARGEFYRLPGNGKPLELHDDSLVPEHLRMGMRLLRNAGFVPPELEMLRELNEVQAQLVAEDTEQAAQRRARLRLSALLARRSKRADAHQPSGPPALPGRLAGASVRNVRRSKRADRDRLTPRNHGGYTGASGAMD